MTETATEFTLLSHLTAQSLHILHSVVVLDHNLIKQVGNLSLGTVHIPR